MPVKFSAALTFVALAAWAATSVATAAPMLSSYGLDTLDATSPAASLASFTLIKQADNSEERVGGLPVGTSMTKEHSIFIENHPYFNVDDLAKFQVAESKIDGAIKDSEYKVLKDAAGHAEKEFKEFGLEQAKDNLFESPLFFKWVAQVKLRYTHLPEALKSRVILMTLREFYEVDDLDRVLIAGTKTEDAKDIAIGLLEAQVDTWMYKTRDEAKVYTLLELGLDDKFDESSLFPIWAKFIAAKYPKLPNGAHILGKYYFWARRHEGDDLAKFLVMATKAVHLEPDAKLLLDVQVNEWVKRKEKAAKVFSLLKLDRTYKFDKRSLYPIWVKFIAAKYPKLPNGAYILGKYYFWATQYKGDDLAKFLVAETKAVHLEPDAKLLLDVQVREWAKHKEDEAKVYTLLELDQTYKFDESLLYPEWVTFVAAKYPDYPNGANILGEYYFLSTMYKGDDNLAKAIVRATKSKGKEPGAKVLLDVQVREWIKHKEDEAKVFTLLELDQTNKFDESLLYPEWVTFIAAKYPDYPDGANILGKKILDEAKLNPKVSIARYRGSTRPTEAGESSNKRPRTST